MEQLVTIGAVFIAVLFFGGLFFLRNISKSWLWMIFLLSCFLFGFINNPFGQVLLVSFNLFSLLLAIRRTFFFKEPTKATPLVGKIYLTLIILILILLIGLRFENYSTQDTKNEFNTILKDSKRHKQLIAQDMTKSQVCFESNELLKEIEYTGNCMLSLKALLDELSREDVIVEKMKLNYEQEKDSLNPNDAKIIEESLKMYDSIEYKRLLESQVSYIQTVYEYYKFLQDNLMNKTSEEQITKEENERMLFLEERMSARTEDYLEAEELFRNSLKDNYSEEFLDLLDSN